jgi:beta-lactamase class A
MDGLRKRAAASAAASLFATLVVGLALLMPVGGSVAQTGTTTGVIERLFHEPVEMDWFSPQFLAAVPPDRVAAIVRALTDEYGALESIEGTGGALTVHLAMADVPARIALDAEGRIATLLFEPAIPTTGTVADYVAAIAALPGRTAVLVTTDGGVVAAHEADAPLAVGSAAKLAILAALEEAIAAGRLSIDQVVPFRAAWSSLPATILANWPVGTPMTVGTLRNLMISMSDNIATDAIIDLVGRTAIEAITPRNTPFPGTAEMFKLQTSPEALATWLSGDAEARRAVLDQLSARPLPTIGELATADTRAEWFMTATELCGLLDRVADSPALAINPGVAERGDWKTVAFKGGSDQGILNLSTRVVGADGKVHCIVATWNGARGIDEGRLTALYRGILHALRGT